MASGKKINKCVIVCKLKGKAESQMIKCSGEKYQNPKYIFGAGIRTESPSVEQAISD